MMRCDREASRILLPMSERGCVILNLFAVTTPSTIRESRRLSNRLSVATSYAHSRFSSVELLYRDRITKLLTYASTVLEAC